MIEEIKNELKEIHDLASQDDLNFLAIVVDREKYGSFR